MQTKAFIIGATGNVGKELVGQLQATQTNFTLGVRSVEKAKALYSPSLSYVLFDYDQPETYLPALAGITQLFMIAPPVTAGALQQAYQLINVAQEAVIKKLVFISASAIEVDENLPLGQIEKRIKQSTIPSGIQPLSGSPSH